MYVNPFNPTTTLAGVEHRAINQRFYGSVQISVFHDIAGIFTAKLKPYASERTAGCRLHRPAASNGACEIHKSKGAVFDQTGRSGVIQEDVLKHIRGNSYGMKRRRHPFAD